jgi:vancomycin resistance protein YoaR
MAKRKTLDIAAPASRPEPPEAPPAPLAEVAFELDTASPWWRRWWVPVLGIVALIAIVYPASFILTHGSTIYPGVVADGLSLGGLSQAQAETRLAEHVQAYRSQALTVTQDNTLLRIPVINLDPQYDAAAAAKLAYQYGRNGNLSQRAYALARLMAFRQTNITTLKTNDKQLAPYLVSLFDDVATPVQNASLMFQDNQAQAKAAQAGRRLDIGQLSLIIRDRLATTSLDQVSAPVYTLAPVLTTAALTAAIGSINQYIATPIMLEYNNQTKTIDQSTIISWVNTATAPQASFWFSRRLEDLYPVASSANLGLSSAAIQRYVQGLAESLNQSARNAALSMQDGQLVITQASRAGIKLDQTQAQTDIAKVLQATGDRRVALKLETLPADVNETNLEDLGIKELISTGDTYFPGSPSTRLTNVRAGAKRFNGVVLKPGETFSFGALLGDVGPATGYVPELVIIGNKEVKQYGGGLCQVSSTAFRAALAAGLPITERVNHSFAISYYTWPYAAPGVDATIYYPDVDFKFVNDTGHYILMQTIMNGYSLKFEFYGTKTKSGVVRGPQFITGSSDATKPSRTVFYRDVLDLDGKVIKTDPFYTNYKSSLDFKIVNELN